MILSKKKIEKRSVSFFLAFLYLCSVLTLIAVDGIEIDAIQLFV